MNFIKKHISKQVGYPIKDKFKKTSIISTLNFLRESQYWSEDKMNDYRLQKLKFLIDYSKKNVPYYEELFNRIKLDSKDIKQLEDIKKIPILTKKVLRKENEKFISRQYNSSIVKKGKTGGTTGSPVLIYKDIYNRSFTWGSYFRWYEWMGLNYYDPVFSLWGAKKVLSSSLKSKFSNKLSNFLLNDTVFNSFEMDNDMMAIIYKKMRKEKPVLIKGYLSSMLKFAEFVQENDLKINGLRAISTTTETLLPHNRALLEKVFGVKLYNQYGCGEISAISYQCPKNSGMHITQEHVICEVLDKRDNDIFNKTGRVVATDLDNLVMPFIRYENGDLATLKVENCSCGINHPFLESVDGRSIETVTLKNGNNVHGVFFTDILYEMNILSDQIQKFQIYQEFVGEIELRIETNLPLNENVKSELELNLKKFLNKVKVIEMKAIPKDHNGKFRYIINNIKR